MHSLTDCNGTIDELFAIDYVASTVDKSQQLRTTLSPWNRVGTTRLSLTGTAVIKQVRLSLH
jgi:hypothetical protein